MSEIDFALLEKMGINLLTRNDALREKMGIFQINSRGRCYVRGLLNELMLIEKDIRALESALKKFPDQIGGETQLVGETLGQLLSLMVMTEQLRPDNARVRKRADQVQKRIDDLVQNHPELAAEVTATLQRIEHRAMARRSH
jgi:hypothetical protein